MLYRDRLKGALYMLHLQVVHDEVGGRVRQKMLSISDDEVTLGELLQCAAVCRVLHLLRISGWQYWHQ